LVLAWATESWLSDSKSVWLIDVFNTEV